MNIQYESTPMDFYDADELPFVNEKIQTYLFMSAIKTA